MFGKKFFNRSPAQQIYAAGPTNIIVVLMTQYGSYFLGKKDLQSWLESGFYTSKNLKAQINNNISKLFKFVKLWEVKT